MKYNGWLLASNEKKVMVGAGLVDKWMVVVVVLLVLEN
jgi:hypothetical protein